MIDFNVTQLLSHTKSLMNHVYWVKEDLNLLPNKDHHGVAIKYIDMTECKIDFCDELVNTITEWVFSGEKAKKIIDRLVSKGRHELNAHSKLRSIALAKFKNRDERAIFLQGQFGELVLFNFLQHFFGCVPLVRKMPLTTSVEHERYGADAIHYKYENSKNIFMLGEVKTYTSNYSFNSAFTRSLESIVSTFNKHREEMSLYVYDDFISEHLIEIAESYKEGTITDAEVHLTCLIIYNETVNITKSTETQIMNDILKQITNRCSSLDKALFKTIDNHILTRLNYIIFPVWKLDELVMTFQNMIGK